MKVMADIDASDLATLVRQAPAGVEVILTRVSHFEAIFDFFARHGC
jgi:hypothetical protein